MLYEGNAWIQIIEQFVGWSMDIYRLIFLNIQNFIDTKIPYQCIFEENQNQTFQNHLCKLYHIAAG